ncbi:MAG: site-specific DNA-methyltransferase, partial [Anaerolineae bacterium]|nr:site-specific DNA-methyltransferase [Anaerolineae bacterium]
MSQWGPDNPHPLSRMKTELVWEGKYDEYGNRRPVRLPESPLPLQRIETIDAPRDTYKAQAIQQGLPFEEEDFRQQAHRDDWRNMLIWGDNKLVMASLLQEFRGKIDLIYIDPPFDVGADFTMKVQIGDGREQVQKEQSILEAVAYRDTWGKGTDSYLHMMYERLTLMHDLLSERGSIYVHCDWRVNFYLRALMDDIFGADAFRNEIVWRYRRWPSKSKLFQRMHDTILWYSKSASSEYVWNQLYEELSESSRRQWKGKVRVDRKSEKGTRYSETLDRESPGVPMSDVWEISQITAPFAEYLGYNTQKPEALLQRIMDAITV